MQISLIIPAYNEENEIGRCLESVLKNSKGKFHEIIVVDNASTDKTAKIAAQFSGVRVVREEHKGLTRARQRGYLEAKGEVLAFIDADTRLPHGWAEQIEKEFLADTRLACLSGPYIYYDLSQWQKFLVRLYWYCLGIPSYIVVGYMVVGGNFAIRRFILDKMKGFDTTIEFYSEDTNIGRRAHEFGKVKFSLSFHMFTSGRRLAKQGFLNVGYVYVVNFISEVLFKKPVHRDYTDIR